jgi:predicted HicB family RNase H-like nuclease
MKHKPPAERVPIKRLTLRIPPGLNNQVKAAAEARGMNVNQFIIFCLDAETPKEC